MTARRPPDALLRRILPQVRWAYPRFAALVERAPRDLSLTSWWRDPAHNAAVGGHPRSQHLYGLAIDLVTRDPAAVVRLARELGLVAVLETDHVHVQAYPAGYVEREFRA